MPADRKLLHRGDFSEALSDQSLELARRIVVESVYKMLVGGRRLAESMELNESSARMCLGETGAARIIPQMALMHREGPASMSILRHPIRQRERNFRRQYPACPDRRQVEIKRRGSLELPLLHGLGNRLAHRARPRARRGTRLTVLSRARRHLAPI